MILGSWGGPSLLTEVLKRREGRQGKVQRETGVGTVRDAVSLALQTEEGTTGRGLGAASRLLGPRQGKGAIPPEETQGGIALA